MSRFVPAALALAAAAGAHAHVTLEQPQASAGAAYKAVLRIGHGCDGSATHTVSVRLPSGFRGAKPMPKPGWALHVERAPLEQPVTSHGRTVTDDVVLVRWTALTRETWLPDAHYDEFVLRGQAPAAAGPAWFKVLQLCEQGRWDWSELPPAGSTSTRGLKAPAVMLDVLAPSTPAAHHH